MPMLPSPICPLAGQSIFGQNVVCGSMTHLPSARSTEECHLIRSFFQVLCFDHRLAYTYRIKKSRKNWLWPSAPSKDTSATFTASLKPGVEFRPWPGPENSGSCRPGALRFVGASILAMDAFMFIDSPPIATPNTSLGYFRPP